jgi:hypothetical protein
MHWIEWQWQFKHSMPQRSAVFANMAAFETLLLKPASNIRPRPSRKLPYTSRSHLRTSTCINWHAEPATRATRPGAQMPWLLWPEGRERYDSQPIMYRSQCRAYYLHPCMRVTDDNKLKSSYVEALIPYAGGQRCCRYPNCVTRLIVGRPLRLRSASQNRINPYRFSAVARCG